MAPDCRNTWHRRFCIPRTVEDCNRDACFIAGGRRSAGQPGPYRKAAPRAYVAAGCVRFLLSTAACPLLSPISHTFILFPASLGRALDRKCHIISIPNEGPADDCVLERNRKGSDGNARAGSCSS